MALDLDSYKQGLETGLKQAPKTIVRTTKKSWSIPTVLFIVFLILKLTHTVDWSWWIITLPLWIGPAFVIGVMAAIGGVILAILAVVGVIALIAWIFGGR
jgi:hypothetical protein